MERKWESMSKKLNEGIINAVAELGFEQMTPVQVYSCYIALPRALSKTYRDDAGTV